MIESTVGGKGEASNRVDLFQKMMEANLARVSPPLDSAEVWKIAEGIAGRYSLGVPVNGGSAA